MLTIIWTALIAWNEITSGTHKNAVETIIAIVHNSASAESLIIMYSLMIVTLSDAIGGFIVVTKRYLMNKWVKPQEEKLRREALKQGLERGLEQGLERGLEQGLERGLEQGLEQGRSEERQAWINRERRRMQAEAQGIPFDEPYPGMDNESDNNYAK